jgi:hypothetical protein
MNLIEQVAERTFQKLGHLGVSYERILEFVRREMIGKTTINSAQLDAIEQRLRSVLNTASVASMSPKNYGRIDPAFLQAHTKFTKERSMQQRTSTMNRSRLTNVQAKRNSAMEVRRADSHAAASPSSYKAARRASSQLGDYATLNTEKRKNSLLAVRQRPRVRNTSSKRHDKNPYVSVDPGIRYLDGGKAGRGAEDIATLEALVVDRERSLTKHTTLDATGPYDLDAYNLKIPQMDFQGAKNQQVEVLRKAQFGSSAKMQLDSFKSSMRTAHLRRMSQTQEAEKRFREREKDLVKMHKQDLDTKKSLARKTTFVV